MCQYRHITLAGYGNPISHACCHLSWTPVRDLLCQAEALLGGLTREWRCSAFIDPSLCQSQGQMGCCSMSRLIFSLTGDRREEQGVPLGVRANERLTVLGSCRSLMCLI